MQVIPPVQDGLQLAQLRYEKCELKEARDVYAATLERARAEGDLRVSMEAIAALLRLAADSMDEAAIQRWEAELSRLMKDHAKDVPPMAWYCLGVIVRRRGDLRSAQRFVHRYLREVRREGGDSLSEVKGLVMLAMILVQRGYLDRADWLTREVLRRFEERQLRSINGLCYLILGNIREKSRQTDEALRWYQRSHASFMGEHHWYFHLYSLYGYARIYRLQRNFSQAYWYLDLLEKATSSAEFAMLQNDIAAERSRLAQDAVDILIDSRQCLVKTREGGAISLGKQYVLLQILEALSNAHERGGEEMERGLSKAEIIQTVWRENYRPEAHDNKLYYNINRLRKLIEPDVRKPQYLLNWKEGYRLAPGLKVQYVGGGKRGESDAI